MINAREKKGDVLQRITDCPREVKFKQVTEESVGDKGAKWGNRVKLLQTKRIKK